MAVTTLKRKARRNSAKAGKRSQRIKLLNKKPVIKKVNVEDLKGEKSESVVEKATKEVKKVVDQVSGSEKTEKETKE